MAENFAKRVGRIVSGSLNAVIDAVEDSSPALVMEQSIRELDIAIDEIRVEKGKAQAAKHLATKRLAAQNLKHSEVSDKIAFAVSQSRDDLAEASIALQLDIEAQLPILEQTIVDCCDKEKQNDGYLNALQAKKREMAAELNLLRNAASNAEDPSDIESVSNNKTHKKAQDAMATFDRVLEKQTGLGGLDIDLKNADKHAELEEMARSNRIKERLASLKNND